MKIWLAESFWESVRRLFRKEQDRQFVYDMLNEYANAGNNAGQRENFDKAHVMKRMKGCSFIQKFYLRGEGFSIGGARVISIPLDSGRAETLQNLNSDIQPPPLSGDILLLGVALHDLQGPEARRLEKRFQNGSRDVCRIESFPPAARTADPSAERKRTIISNAGLYVSKTPFNTYQDYEVWVQGGDAKLSDKQFDILQAILGDRKSIQSPFFVTGCAGSGKTLLAATVLNLLSPLEGLPNVYFVLSNASAAKRRTRPFESRSSKSAGTRTKRRLHGSATF